MGDLKGKRGKDIKRSTEKKKQDPRFIPLGRQKRPTSGKIGEKKPSGNGKGQKPGRHRNLRTEISTLR